MLLANFRIDKKCGASGIAKNKKCSKPTTAAAAPANRKAANAKAAARRAKKNRETTLKTIGLVTAAAAVGIGLSYAKHRRTMRGLDDSMQRLKKTTEMLRKQRKVNEQNTKKRATAWAEWKTKNYNATDDQHYKAYEDIYGKEQAKYYKTFREFYREQTRSQRANTSSGKTASVRKPTKSFSVLGVGPDASPEDVKRAYKAAARKNHPDLGGDVEAMKGVNAAYDNIMKWFETQTKRDSAYAMAYFNQIWDLGPQWNWARELQI